MCISSWTMYTEPCTRGRGRLKVCAEQAPRHNAEAPDPARIWHGFLQHASDVLPAHVMHVTLSSLLLRLLGWLWAEMNAVHAPTEFG